MARKNYNKHQIRELYKDSIIHTDRQTKISELKRIMNLLTYREEYTDAKVIAFYWPKDTELDTIPMIDFSLYQGKRVVLPHITSDTNMEFKEIESVEFEREIFKGITQPTKEHVTVSKEEIDLFIIPVVAFDRDGHRVGSGKGYYDRFFENMDDVTSIIVSLATREHNFKVETHDIASKIIITEEKLIRIHESGYHLNDKDELIIPTLELHIDPKDLEDTKEVDDFLDDSFDKDDKTEETAVESKDNKDSKTSEDDKDSKTSEDDKDSKEEVDKDEMDTTADLEDIIDDAPKDEAKKKVDKEEKSMNKTMNAMGMTRKEMNKKRKEEAKEAKKKLKEQAAAAKKIAKADEEDSVEDDLRAKLANDDKKKKNDLSDIPDADKLLAILESKEIKPKKEKKVKKKKPKKEKKFKKIKKTKE